VEAVHLVASVLSGLLLLYILVLLVRMLLDYIPVFSRGWRPQGAGLVLAEIVYLVTDPPIRLLRRFLRPVRIGPVAIDFAFTIVLLACFVLLSITRSLAVL
jgi:YggT family protein